MGNSCCRLHFNRSDSQLVKISTNEPHPWELSCGSIANQSDSNPVPLRWSKGRVLAEGGFGQVFAGLNLDTGQPIAIKQVLIPEFITKKDLERVKEIEDEIGVLKRLRHPNIVQYLGTQRTDDSLVIFLEYAGGGSVTTLLDKYGPFPETVIQVYIKQVVLGLEFLHRHGIAHRDIKGGNVLVTDGGIVKLADFGASKQRAPDTSSLENAYQSLKGTPCFMAPEVIRQEGYGNRADIWSVGCTVIEMATGNPPWSEKKDSCTIMFNIVTAAGPPAFPKQVSPMARDFLARCFERNPVRRATAMELLEHPFLRNVKLKPSEGVAQMRVGSFKSSQTRQASSSAPSPPQISPPSNHASSQGSSYRRSRYMAAVNRASSTKPGPQPSNLMTELRDVLQQRRVSQGVNDFSLRSVPARGAENMRPAGAPMRQDSSKHSYQDSRGAWSKCSRVSGADDARGTPSGSSGTPPLPPGGGLRQRRKDWNGGLGATRSKEKRLVRSVTAPIGTPNQQCGVGMGHVMKELTARFKDGSLPVHRASYLS